MSSVVDLVHLRPKRDPNPVHSTHGIPSPSSTTATVSAMPPVEFPPFASVVMGAVPGSLATVGRAGQVFDRSSELAERDICPTPSTHRLAERLDTCHRRD